MIILQTKRPRKSMPFLAALSIWMKKLYPNRKAKILINRPIMILFPIHCAASSNAGNRSTSSCERPNPVPKRWSICMMITPNKANPLKVSNTDMRFNGADNDMCFSILSIFSLVFKYPVHYEKFHKANPISNF